MVSYFNPFCAICTVTMLNDFEVLAGLKDSHDDRKVLREMYYFFIELTDDLPSRGLQKPAIKVGNIILIYSVFM